MSQLLQLLWVSCSESRSGTELFEECKRHCTVSRCLPGQALKMLVTGRPDAVVFDFLHPAAAHLQLLQSVKRQYPSVPIVMITESHSEELAVWADRIASSGAREVWVYFNNDRDGFAVKNALRLRRMLRETQKTRNPRVRLIRKK